MLLFPHIVFNWFPQGTDSVPYVLVAYLGSGPRNFGG